MIFVLDFEFIPLSNLFRFEILNGLVIFRSLSAFKAHKYHLLPEIPLL